MSPRVLMHFVAAIGAAAVGVVALSRGTRSPVLVGVFATALTVAFWNTSNAFNVMSGDLFWRILSPGLGALPFGAFGSLALRAALRPAPWRRWLELAIMVLVAALSLFTLSGFFLDASRRFVLSPRWNLLLVAVALPCMLVSAASLGWGALRGSPQRRQFSIILLVAGAIGFVGGLSEVLPVDRPLQLGALGLLLAVVIGAVGVSARGQAEETIALKEILFSVGVVAGIVVAAVLVVSRTHHQPALTAAVLSALGLLAFGAYRWVLWRWQRRLEAAARLATLGRATSVLAHEVRNPLTTVQGAIDILEVELQRGGGDHPASRYLDAVRVELRRVLELVEDCLAYARSPAPNRERFDLRRLLARGVEAARLRFPEATLELVEVPEPVEVLGDASQLGRLLENLLVNACQTGPRPRVRVEICAADGREVAVAVGDDGPGVALELRERIFEPFFTTKTRGGGLGLAIVREIARRHGGDVAVQVAATGGARFVARWQRAPE